MSHFASVTYRDNFPASLPATCRQKRYMFKPHNTISRTCFMAQQMHIVHSDFIEYDNVTIRKPSKKVVSPDGFEALLTWTSLPIIIGNLLFIQSHQRLFFLNYSWDMDLYQLVKPPVNDYSVVNVNLWQAIIPGASKTWFQQSWSYLMQQKRKLIT